MPAIISANIHIIRVGFTAISELSSAAVALIIVEMAISIRNADSLIVIPFLHRLYYVNSSPIRRII
jgi:hypothetical protein